MKEKVTFFAVLASLAAVSAPVLPGYLTDPSIMRAETTAEGAYCPPESLQFPYLATYYVQPVVSSSSDVQISFFVTDFDHAKVRYLDDSHQFAAFLELRPKGTQAWKRFVLKKLKSGDHTFNLGRLSPGSYEMRVWAIDRQLRESHRVLHDFRVSDENVSGTGVEDKMTEADLATYGIRNDGNLAAIIWEGESGSKTMRSKNPNRPGYTIHVPLKGEKPVFRSAAAATIDYDKGYDAQAIEDEAFRNVCGLQKLLDAKAAAGVRRFVLLPGTYLISHKQSLNIPDDFVLDLNGATLKQNSFTGCHSIIVNFPSSKRAVLTNGTLEGDYYEHDYKNSEKNSEWPMGFNISGASEECRVEKVKIVNITGYGGGNGIGKDARGGLAYFSSSVANKFVAGGLDRKTGEVNAADKFQFTSDFRPLDKAKTEGGGRLQISKYLGYQGRSTRAWQMIVAWYDATKKFVYAETAWQYREMFVPPEAAFLRVSIQEANLEKANACGLNICRFRVPTNCAVKDCTFERCRCVGYAASAMKNHLFEGNFFTASGENAAKCAFDAEDGWDQMQDVYFLRNRFRDNPVNNSILTCAGHNFILEKNDCAIHFWGRTHSPCVRDNDVSTAVYICDSRLRSGYGRFENNRYTKSVELGRGKRTDGWDFVLSGLKLDGSKDPVFSLATGENGRFVACTFKGFPVKVANAFACTFENCEASFMPSGRWFETTVKNCKFHYFYGTNVFTRCHFSNTYLQGFRNGRFEVSGGDFTDCHIQDLDTSNFSFNGTTFKGSHFAFGYWNKPAKMRFSKCSIATAEQEPFLKIALYTIGQIAFDACTIEGPKPLVSIADLRAQPTDNIPGLMGLRACTWKGTSPVAIVRSNGSVSPKKLTFVDEKNSFPKGTAMLDATLPPTWTKR